MNTTTGTPNALALCLQLAQAHARLTLKLDDELGTSHGLAFADLLLLHRIAQAEGGRLAIDRLAPLLGLTPSAALRRVLPLEKTGLVERLPGAPGNRTGVAVLRPAARAVLQQALETTEAICSDALEELPVREADAAQGVFETLCGSTALRL